MKKKRFISISLILAFVLIFSPIKINAENSFTNGSYITPYSANLPISRYNGTVAFMDYPDHTTLYPLAVKIMDASNLYNCFTFAFIYDGNTSYLSDMPLSETFALDDPYFLIGSQNPCYEYVDFDDVEVGDIAIYRYTAKFNVTEHNNFIHAGIVTYKGTSLENTYTLSKWGEYSIYCHTIVDCPYTGSSISLAAFDDPLAPYAVGISFARMTHSYDYYNYYVVPVDSETVIQSDTYHKLKCSGCGAFHFENHDEKGSEAIIVTIGTLTNSTQHRVICGCGYNHNTKEAHSYGNDGLCKDCGYSPIMLNNIEEVEDQ